MPARAAARPRGHVYKRRIVFAEHHESHAASAFFPSPFDEAAILTLDGVGEWATATLRHGRGHTHRHHARAALPALARPALFRVHLLLRVQGQLRRIQADGPRAVRRAALRRSHPSSRLVDIKDDGSFWMDMPYFNYCQGSTMTSQKFDALFGGPPRAAGGADHRARDGHRGVDPEGHRRRDAARRPSRARADGHARTCASPAASRSTASATAASCAKVRSRTSGFSRPRAMPAARSARRSTSGTSCSASRAHAAAGRQHARRRCSVRASTMTRDSRAVSIGSGAPLHGACRPTTRSATHVADLLAQGIGRRLVSGPDGVRPACARRAQHHRRCAEPAAAVDDEPEDQVSRVVPAVRAGRAQGARRRLSSR